jgi:hypothetical protein
VKQPRVLFQRLAENNNLSLVMQIMDGYVDYGRMQIMDGYVMDGYVSCSGSSSLGRARHDFKTIGSVVVFLV